MSGRIRRCSVRFAGGESRNYMRGMVSYTQRSLAMTVCSDRRQGKPSPKRVPVARVEQVLGLYRDRYFDLNVRHFHEKLQHEHQIELSYTWVKLALHFCAMTLFQRIGEKRYSSRQKRPIKTKMMMISNTNPSPPLG